MLLKMQEQSVLLSHQPLLAASFPSAFILPLAPEGWWSSPRQKRPLCDTTHPFHPRPYKAASFLSLAV